MEGSKICTAEKYGEIAITSQVCRKASRESVKVTKVACPAVRGLNSERGKFGLPLPVTNQPIEQKVQVPVLAERRELRVLDTNLFLCELSGRTIICALPHPKKCVLRRSNLHSDVK